MDRLPVDQVAPWDVAKVGITWSRTVLADRRQLLCVRAQERDGEAGSPRSGLPGRPGLPSPAVISVFSV